jgi:hypothetical protein
MGFSVSRMVKVWFKKGVAKLMHGGAPCVELDWPSHHRVAHGLAIATAKFQYQKIRLLEMKRVM